MRMFLAAAFTVLAPAAAAAPSFDCAKAGTPVEKLICADAGLSAADSALAAGYTKVTASHPELKDALRDSQRQWLSQRGNCLSGARAEQIACLKQRYSERQAKLAGPSLLACAKPVMAGAAFTLRCVAPNSPAHLTAVVTGKKGEYDAELAKLTLTANGKIVTFPLSDASLPFDILTSAVDLIDVNFDGFDDVKLAVSTSAGPNMGYAYWLYQPKTGSFAASNLGEQLSGFEVMPDAKTKTIAVNSRSSCCAWNVSTYGWKGASLVLRQSADSGEFSLSDLPGLDGLEQQICGSETKHFNEAGLITRIDIVTGPAADAECSKEAIRSEAVLQGKLKSAKGLRIEPSKIPGAFAVIFDKPRKPAY